MHCHLAHPKLCVCQRMYRWEGLKKKIGLQHCFLRVCKAVFFGLLLFLCVFWLFQLLISPHNFFKSSRWKSGTTLLLILSFFFQIKCGICVGVTIFKFPHWQELLRAGWRLYLLMIFICANKADWKWEIQQWLLTVFKMSPSSGPVEPLFIQSFLK